MSNLKEQVINKIIEVEGGYVNDAADSGGETKYGITVAVARANGYAGPMRDLPYSVAFNIYSAKYWDAVRADDIARLAPAIAEEVVDTAVNMGVERAGIILQRALNALNNCSTLYADLTADGAIGPATIGALKAYLGKREENILLKALNVLQGAYYIELTERRQKDEKYLFGWLKNRVSL